MSGENGSHVTRAELRAHLDPMRADITEIKDDVKSLLYAAATQKGVELEQGKLTTTKRKVSDRRIAVGALLVGLLSALSWVPESVARVFHH